MAEQTNQIFQEAVNSLASGITEITTFVNSIKAKMNSLPIVDGDFMDYVPDSKEMSSLRSRLKAAEKGKVGEGDGFMFLTEEDKRNRIASINAEINSLSNDMLRNNGKGLSLRQKIEGIKNVKTWISDFSTGIEPLKDINFDTINEVNETLNSFDVENIVGISSTLGIISSALNSVKDYTPKKDEGGKQWEPIAFSLDGKPTMWGEVDVPARLGLESRIKTIPKLASSIGLFSREISALVSDSDIAYLSNFELRKTLSSLKPYRTDKGWGSGTAEQIAGITSVLSLVGSTLNSVKDYAPKKDEGGKQWEPIAFSLDGKPTMWGEVDVPARLGIESRIKTIPKLASSIGLFSREISAFVSDSDIAYLSNFELRKSLSALKPYRTKDGWGSGTAEQIAGITSVLQVVGKNINSVKDYAPKKDEGGKQWEPIAFSLDGKPTMWGEVDVPARLGLESRIKTIPKLASSIGLFSREISALVSDPDIAYFNNFELRKELSALKPYRTKDGWGSGTAEQIAGITSVLQVVAKNLNSVKDYTPKKDEGGKQWEPIAFSLDGKPTMWEEVDVPARLGIESRIKTIPKLASVIGLFSRSISALVSDPDIAYFSNFELRKTMSALKPYRTDKGWGSGTAEQIAGIASVLNLVGKAMDKMPEYGTTKEGQKPVIARLNILRKRLPRDISVLTELITDIHDSQTGMDTMAKKLRLGSDFDLIESYKCTEGENFGKTISVSSYSELSDDEKLKYKANTKSTSSLVYIDLAANYVNSLVKTLSKISSVSVRDLRKSSRSANRLAKTIPGTIRDMVDMLRTINTTTGSADEIRKLIGWNEGFGKEFVTYTAIDPETKVAYEKILEVKSDNEWGGTEKVKNLRYTKPHYEAETGLFLIGDYVSKVIGSIDKITSLDPKGIRNKARKFRRGIRPLVSMLRAAVTELTNQLGKSTIDNSTIEFLTGSETSEERYVDILKKGYSTGGESARETSTEDHTVSKINTKKAGLLDVTSRVFEIIDKMVNFPFGDNIKKLTKFRVKSVFLGSALKGSVNDLVGMFDSVSNAANSRNLSKENMNALVGFVGKEGLQGLILEITKTTDIYSKMLGKVFLVNAMLSMMPGKNRRKGANDSADKDPVIDIVDTMLAIGLEMSGNTLIIDNQGDQTILTNEEIKQGSERAKLLSGLMSAMIPMVTKYQLVSMLSIGARNETNMALVANKVIDTASVFGTREKEISESRKPMLELVAGITVLAALLLLVVRPIGKDAGSIGMGMAAMGAVSFGSVNILDKVSENIETIREGSIALLIIAGAFTGFALTMLVLGYVSDKSWTALAMFGLMVAMSVGVLLLVNHFVNRGSINKNGIPDACMPLMLIAGSFLMFSMSILLLGLVQDLAWNSLWQFSLLVGLAVGVLWLISKTDKASIKGALILMIVGGAFIVFSTVLMILSRIAEDCDSLQMLGLVGIIAALIGVAVLAGFAIIPLALGSIGLILLSASLLVFSIAITALYGVSKLIGDDAEQAISPLIDTIDVIVKKMSAMSVKDVAVATANSLLALVMIASMVGVAAMIQALKAIAPKPNETEEVSMAMKGVVGALNTISKELSKISLGDMTKALVISTEALLMLVPLSIVALILLGFSRMRIATEFGSDNKPTKWESLDGSSFDRVGDAMKGMVSAINNIVDKINEVGIVAMTKAVAKSVEMLAMVAALSGVMGLLAKMGSGRIAVEWDKDNKPTKWENFDSGMIDRSVDIARLLVESVGSISKGIAEYDTGELKKAKKNAKTMKGILKPISSMLDIVIKLTSGPLNYGPCDEDGNPIGTGDKSISGNVGDYLKSHKKQITDNIDTLIDIFNGIAEKVSGDRGIGKIDRNTLKRAKKNMKLVGQITGSLQPMIELITSLTSGQYNVGTEEEPKMMNLGDYISKKKPEVTKNLDNLFDFIMWIGQKADKMNEGPSNKELRRANRKMGKIGDIIESLNAPLDLIMKMSDGEFEIKDEQGNLIEKMNLGQYIATKSKDVESNLDTLISFISHIGDRINTELNGDGGPSKRDLKKADKKTGLIGTVLETMIGTLDIIEKMASGQIQVGVDENDKPIMKSLSQFLNDSAGGIKKNIGLLIDFIVGPDGIQSQIDKITGEKSKTSEKKQNQIDTLQMFSDTIGSILDLTMDIGKQIDDPKTRDLFGTDKDKSLKSRIGRLMEGYSVPMDDTAIFSKTSEFRTRYRHLSDYDELMKKIMDVKHVDNFEKSVKATGDMVNSINSINDTKIDKLNTLMRNMIAFGKTMDESLKEVFDRIVELAEELHYIIEADMKKNNPEEYKRQKQQEQRQMQASANPLSPKNQSQPQSQQRNRAQVADMSSVEDRLADIAKLVRSIQEKMP